VNPVGGLSGGLVGRNVGHIEYCYSDVDFVSVEGRQVGALTGFNKFDSKYDNYAPAGLFNCYAAGSVTTGTETTPYRIGGLFGHAIGGEDYSVVNCYSVAEVLVSGEGAGGLAGENTATVENCFWDMEATGQSISAAGTGKTTAEMKDNNTFLDAGWDYVEVWSQASGSYPLLLWQLDN
jgi:hypothetical protein